jgi:hypothetical protein
MCIDACCYSFVSDNDADDHDASQMSDNDSDKSSPLTASLVQPTKVRITNSKHLMAPLMPIKSVDQ